MVLFYFLPPVVTFLLSRSPSRRLEYPVGVPDPLSLIGITTNNPTRAFLYSIGWVSNMVQYYIMNLGNALIFIFLDSLKTAFLICGHSLETHGRDGCLSWHQFLSAIKLHQRLFRLTSKVKHVIEPIIAVTISGTASYNVICALSISQGFHAQNIKMLFGGVVIIVISYVLFAEPGSTAHKAEEMAVRIYFNQNWVAQRCKLTRYLPLMIMRSNKPVKFRMFNCWAMTSENLVKVKKSFMFIHTSVNFHMKRKSLNIHLNTGLWIIVNTVSLIGEKEKYSITPVNLAYS
ncbi:uncharacterized protein [Bemisia tabaci]|uniref:uncharacterized protein isoform X1 n=1 Tax=Bemisia tabaci TaxID=7038 RepID=UPI003B285877